MNAAGTLVQEALIAADSALRRPTGGAADSESRPAARVRTLLLAIVLLAPIYGAAMGSYSLLDPERGIITLYAAIKAPMLMLVTTALCLGPFAVLGYVARLGEVFPRALVAILSGQACAALVLASAAPITLVAYTAISSHDHAILYNAGVFGLAAMFGHRATLHRFRPLFVIHPRCRPLLVFWCVLYCFVGVQMGWTLRPFVGSPGTSGAFFREDSFTNAYVAVGRIVSNALGL